MGLLDQKTGAEPYWDAIRANLKPFPKEWAEKPPECRVPITRDEARDVEMFRAARRKALPGLKGGG